MPLGGKFRLRSATEPLRQDEWEFAPDGVEDRTCLSAFWSGIRSVVENRCAALTNVAWCQPRQQRASRGPPECDLQLMMVVFDAPANNLTVGTRSVRLRGGNNSLTSESSACPIRMMSASARMGCYTTTETMSNYLVESASRNALSHSR